MTTAATHSTKTSPGALIDGPLAGRVVGTVFVLAMLLFMAALVTL